MQDRLDKRIIKKHGLKRKNLLDGKILALKVEIGELANETRCFKFWSVKPPSSREVILEEYVDGIHFLLSIALEIKERLSFPNSPVDDPVKCASMIEQFNDMYAAITRFEKLAYCSAVSLEMEFMEMWNVYMGLGDMLGFSQAEIEEYYIRKNQINHERQDTGY